MEIYVNNVFYFRIFHLLLVSYIILSNALILPISQLQKPEEMTSLSRSHTEYLIQTYHILVLILQSKLV